MIVVTGDAVARPETFDEVRRLSLEHVHRSRTEPGCISHALHIDCVNPLRFVFVEQWADKEVLMDHFRIPEPCAGCSLNHRQSRSTRRRLCTCHSGAEANL